MEKLKIRVNPTIKIMNRNNTPNGHHHHPLQTRHCAAFASAFQRIDESLEEKTGFSNAEKIRLMRQAYFKSVDELQKSGRFDQLMEKIRPNPTKSDHRNHEPDP